MDYRELTPSERAKLTTHKVRSLDEALQTEDERIAAAVRAADDRWQEFVTKQQLTIIELRAANRALAERVLELESQNSTQEV